MTNWFALHLAFGIQLKRNYSTIKKEILAIINCGKKYEMDLINQEFLIRIDCQATKHLLEKYVKNIASKQYLLDDKLFSANLILKLNLLKQNQILSQKFLQEMRPAIHPNIKKFLHPLHRWSSIANAIFKH